MAGRSTRRQLFRVGAAISLSAIAVACNSQAIPVPTPAPQTPTGGGAAASATNTPAAAAPATAPTPTAASQPAPAAPANLPEVPRNETLIMSVSDSVNQMNDATLFNPHLNGAQRTGWHFAFEPLYFYNPWWSKEVSGPPGARIPVP